jgi:DHA2 family multidrug resistance protein-like MFS transporter
MALVVLDAGIANIALPSITVALGIAPAEAVLVVTAYQLALVMALLPCAAIGERYGYRRVLVAGVTLFTGASALCALAPTLPWLLAARLVQGLGGSAVMALGVALLRLCVRPDQLGRAISWNALTVALAGAAAPTIGALVLSLASWRWLFAINLPLGLVGLVASTSLPVAKGSGERLDLISVALTGAIFAAWVLGAEHLIDAPVAAGAAVTAASIGLVALVRRERAKPAPLIPIDLLRSPPFRSSVIASVACFSGQTVALVALPFYLQHSLGQSALATGFYMTVWPLSVAVTATVSGRLSDRFATATLCAIGGTCLAVGLAATALWPLAGDLRPLVLFTILCGVGFGLFNVPNNRNMFLSAPRDRSAAAGGAQGTARLTGQTAGAVFMTLLFSASSLELAPRVGLVVGAGLTLLAAVVSLTRERSQ